MNTLIVFAGGLREVPGFSVGFPGWLGALADLRPLDVIGEFDGIFERIVGLSRQIGTLLEDGGEGFGGVASERFGRGLSFGSDDLFRGPFGDDEATGVAGFGAHIENPVRGLDHIEIVFDDDDRIADIDQAVEDLEKFGDIFEVESSGGFIEEVEGFAGGGSCQFSGKFDALGLASAEGGCGLAEGDVFETDIAEGFEDMANFGDIEEEFVGLSDLHFEDIVDGVTLIAHAEDFLGEAFSLAGFAGDPDIGEEVHFDFDLSEAFTFLAATAGNIEAEVAWGEAADEGIRDLGEELADGIEDTGVGGWVGGGRRAKRGLADHDDLIDPLGPLEVVEGSGFELGAMEFLGEGRVEDIHDEAALAAATRAGDRDQATERKLGVNILEGVVASTEDLEPIPAWWFGGGGASIGRDGDRFLSGEEGAGDGFRFLGDLGRGALGDEVSAVSAGAGSKIAELIGAGDDIAIMLDHDQGVSKVAQFVEGGEEAVIVAGMESDGGFIEDVEDAAESASKLAGQTYPLCLATAERIGGAAEVEIIETDIDEELEAELDFTQDFTGDTGFTLIEFPAADFGEELVEGKVDEVDDGAIAPAAGDGFWSDASPFAGRARDFGREAVEGVSKDGGGA